jgi:hypothetical protein
LAGRREGAGGRFPRKEGIQLPPPRGAWGAAVPHRLRGEGVVTVKLRFTVKNGRRAGKTFEFTGPMSITRVALNVTE